jgi:ribonuclease J
MQNNRKPFKKFTQNSDLLERKGSYVSPLKEGNYRIINLGGTEECGKNMIAIEYKDTILLINAGVQFSASKMPGVDYIIPNTKYIEENYSKIKGVIITNSSLENSGALPFLMEKLDIKRVYGRLFTNTLIQKRMEDKQIISNAEFVPIEEEIDISVGDIDVTFISINHTTPDYLSVVIKAVGGDIVYSNDTKNIKHALKSGPDSAGKNMLLIAESMNTETGGKAINYLDVQNELESTFTRSTKKIIVSTFANNIFHIKAIIDISKKLNKKIVIDSDTISFNILSAQETGILGDMSDLLIDMKDIKSYKSAEIVILNSGEEGREDINLSKIVDGDNEYIKLEEGDTVIIATHPIIHNQRMAQNLKDSISRLGGIIKHYKYGDILMSNGANFDELTDLHRHMSPKFFMPVAGCHYMLRVHADIERKIGTPENHIIIPDNGMIVELQESGMRISNTREKVESEMVVVDGNKIGKLHNVVLKDREILGAQGVFFAIILLDMRGHKLKKTPDIATRGFVFLKESQDLLNGARVIINDMMTDYLSKNRHIEIDDIKSDLQNMLQKYLMTKTAKEPVVIPLIIKV